MFFSSFFKKIKCHFFIIIIIKNATVFYISTGIYYKLFNDLLETQEINPLVRPVKNLSKTTKVYLSLKLLQILSINEKDQYMQTSILLTQQWKDEFLQWNPKEYNGIEKIHVPIEKIWNPEIVLFNCVDGNHKVDLRPMALVKYTGDVLWEPPAVFKSSCTMNVQFFPFDEQTCPMKFGSWKYDSHQVDIFMTKQRTNIDSNTVSNAVDLSEHSPNLAWYLTDVPGQRHMGNYKCCPQQYTDLTFYITIRRRSLFLTINLIIPCVGISFLAVLTFYLPSESGEKISLSIAIMMSLSVFVLLLAELVPATSIVVPIVGKYLLFTEILVTIAIVITVGVLNVHFRSPLTNPMRHWVRILYTRVLPKVLMLKQPESNFTSLFQIIPNDNESNDFSKLKNYNIQSNDEDRGSTSTNKSQQQKSYLKRTFLQLCKLVNEIQIRQKWNKIKGDWKSIALVLDRLFLLIFTTASIIGTLGIICQSPTIYSQIKVLAE